MFRVHAYGDLALFARPELTIDKFSYPMITPPAARGLMECIYWHPGVEWIIDRIYVRSQIKYVNTSFDSSTSVFALQNVDYIIDSHFVITDKAGPADNPGKITDIIRRRLDRENYYKSPYFGSADFPAYVEPCPFKHIKTAYTGILDLGLMPYTYDYTKNTPSPFFFHACLNEGILDLKRPPKLLR